MIATVRCPHCFTVSPASPSSECPRCYRPLPTEVAGAKRPTDRFRRDVAVPVPKRGFPGNRQKHISQAKAIELRYSDIVDRWNATKAGKRIERAGACQRDGHLFVLIAPFDDDNETFVCKTCLKYREIPRGAEVESFSLDETLTAIRDEFVAMDIKIDDDELLDAVDNDGRSGAMGADLMGALDRTVER